MTREPTELSVVISTRNNAAIISTMIERVHSSVTQLGCSFEIIVVDSDSSDDTRNLAKSAGARVTNLAHYPPYGEILKRAFDEARGDYVITLDADLLLDYRIIADFWNQRNRGELLIGSRYVAGGSARMPLPRLLVSRLLNQFYAVFLSLPFRDISSGYRMFDKRILEDIELDSRDYSILIESLLKAHACGWIVKEIPFRFEPETFSSSTKRVIAFFVTYLRSLIRMWQLRNSVFSADYDERAYNSIIPLQRYWQRTRYRLIMSLLERHGQILDIGCGSSRIIQQLPGAVGLDILLKKLRYLRGSGVLLARADINELPFKTAVFSLVICSQVIEHVPFERAIFTEINRVLSSNGILIMGTPDYGRRSWRIIEFFYEKLLPGAYAEQHITHYTRQSLEQILRECGFKILEHRYVCGSELIIKARKTNDWDTDQTAN
jgi:dolichol-phosphate mannosyltransferase